MAPLTGELFDVAVWGPALEKYGTVVHLSVALYGADAQILYGPMPATPLCEVLDEHGQDAGGFAECARACLAQSIDSRPAVIVTRSSLAAVGVALLLNGEIVGALVAGYALVTVCESLAISRLARQSSTIFPGTVSCSDATTGPPAAPDPARRAPADIG